MEATKKTMSWNLIIKIYTNNSFYVFLFFTLECIIINVSKWVWISNLNFITI